MPASMTGTLMPGVITLTQPKVPAAKIRGSQKGFQCVILGLERVQGSSTGCQGVPRDPRDPLSYQPCVDAEELRDGCLDCHGHRSWCARGGVWEVHSRCLLLLLDLSG
jgi:hypothetical protein